LNCGKRNGQTLTSEQGNVDAKIETPWALKEGRSRVEFKVRVTGLVVPSPTN